MPFDREKRLRALAALVLVVAACEDGPPAPGSDADTESRSHEQASSVSMAEHEWAALQRDLEAQSSAALAKLAAGAEEAAAARWGRIGGMPSPKPPAVRRGAVSVTGGLPREVVERVVRENLGSLRLCYENGLRSNPFLAGTLFVEFTIAAAGSVSQVSGSASTLPDSAVIECVTKAFGALTFPPPKSGSVQVGYPIAFSPGGDVTIAPTLQGKALASVTWKDLESALEKAGCTDVEKISASGAPSTRSSARAKKDGRSVTILLINGEALDRGEVASLETAGLVFEAHSFLIAISIERDTNKSAATRLLDALIAKS